MRKIIAGINMTLDGFCDHTAILPAEEIHQHYNGLEDVVLGLKHSCTEASKNILVGSRSIIIQLLKLNLIDELQLCVHPVIAGGGLPLFENMVDKTTLKLIKSTTFSGGAVILYYDPKAE